MKVKHLILFSFFSMAAAAQKPPMGWNSFDSYGVYLYEEAAFKNLNVLAEKYKPFGYEYFVIDNGWFGEYNLKQGTIYAAERHASDIRINEYGLVQPSHTYFPNGFKALIDECHARGLKFGLHLMRGIPRKAVEQNTPIQGTNYHARDIADTIHYCTWCQYNYGVDMSKPGAQEFYNSLVNQLASWGVDFIKADDIVPFPEEVDALANAIAQCGRPIVLSLSPGDHVADKDLFLLRRGNMLRVTADVWDDQNGLNNCFNAWRRWSGHEQPDFWMDMDMIPFGKLQLMSPPSDGSKGENIVLLSGKGNTRQSLLSPAQMRTFITMRALAASPLMIGGDLPTMDDYSFSLLTNADMLAANQNGVMGKLIFEKNGIEIWNTPAQDKKGGWIGVFNRNAQTESITLQWNDLGLTKNCRLTDIWHKKAKLNIGSPISIEANDVIFIRYTLNPSAQARDKTSATNDAPIR